MSFNFNTHLMCDRCGTYLQKDNPPSPAKQLAIAKARGWSREGEWHYCPQCKPKKK